MNPSWGKANLFLVPAVAFLLTTLLVPLISRLASRWKCVALPNKERWHTRPTPMLGGLAFFLGFLVPVLLLSPHASGALPFFLIVMLLFAVGIYDDLYRISPTTKLMAQIIGAAIALALFV